MPPSPLLSARVMKVTYLSATTTISDQMITDKIPRILSGVIGAGWGPAKISFIVYSGLALISPNTTPSAVSASAAVRPPC